MYILLSILFLPYCVFLLIISRVQSSMVRFFIVSSFIIVLCFFCFFVLCFILVCRIVLVLFLFHFFFFKQKTAYEMRISDWSSDVCSSDLDMSRVISPTDRLLLKARADGVEGLPDGAPQFGQINITLAKFYRITGSSTQHKGVEPDIVFPSVYAAEKYGESSEPSALPWDRISATDFAPVADLDPIIGQLATKHQTRMEGTAAYGFLLEDIETMKDRKSTRLTSRH